MAFVRESLLTPIETDPLSEFSRVLDHGDTRHWPIDKGPYLGTYHVGYLVQEEQKRCVVFLIQTNGTFDDFLNRAILRARETGLTSRE